MLVAPQLPPFKFHSLERLVVQSSLPPSQICLFPAICQDVIDHDLLALLILDLSLAPATNHEPGAGIPGYHRPSSVQSSRVQRQELVQCGR
jgi:hypothetical protein